MCTVPTFTIIKINNEEYQKSNLEISVAAGSCQKDDMWTFHFGFWEPIRMLRKKLKIKNIAFSFYLIGDPYY